MGHAQLSDLDLASCVARLTVGQRECLDLVDDHATSKEIARQLGISRHTVDARLRGAIQTLGVSSRREAAMIYRAALQAQSQAYQPFVYQPAQLVEDAFSPSKQIHDEVETLQDADFAEDLDFDAHKGFMPGATSPVGAAHVRTAQANPNHVADAAVWHGSAPVEFRPSHGNLRLWGGVNDLTPGQRMFGIVMIMILSMLAFGMFLSGIQALVLLRT